MKVFGYVRLSEDEVGKSKDEQNRSILNQRELIVDYCSGAGKVLVNIFDEGKSVSGSDRNRKAFGEMISRAVAGEVVEIVVKHRDRFVRDPAFFQDTLTDLRAYGVKVYSVEKKGYLDNDDLGDTIGSVMDGQYVRECRRKAGMMIEQKMRKGLPFTSPPFGYKWSGSEGERDRGWVQVPKEVIVVRKVFEMLAGGALKKNIAVELGLDESKVHRILKAKRAYEGFLVWRRPVKDSKGNVVRVEIEEHKGVHTPILGG